MGYTTNFEGNLVLSPKLSDAQAAFINKLADTRRMKRSFMRLVGVPDPIREAVGLPPGDEGEFFVGEPGDFGQGDHFKSVLDNNRPPGTQPGLWCQWIIDDDGDLVWNGGEKFYKYTEWLEYLIEKLFKPWGIKANGQFIWQGEETGDVGTIVVEDNVVTVHKNVQLKADSDTTMTFNAYAQGVPKLPNTALGSLGYSALGLAGKSGEIASLIKKATRDANGIPKDVLCVELGNALFYLNAVAISAGLTLDEVAGASLKRLAQKYGNHHV